MYWGRLKMFIKRMNKGQLGSAAFPKGDALAAFVAYPGYAAG
jgi:hypothetical protein